MVSSCGLALINPRDQATNDAGAALDLVFVSADCPSTLRIHDGIGCCARAPGCCPVMGSDHRLCVVSTQLNCRTTHHVPRGIPHLREWSSTLFRAHVDLCQWSSDVCCWLDGVVPCDVATRGHSAWHAPRQRCFHRRSQPSWWTPECFATCVARNGAWRDYRRVHTLAALTDSGLLGPHSIGQCVRPSGPSGRTGKTVLPGSPARTLVLPLPPFDALFAALLLPEVILLLK